MQRVPVKSTTLSTTYRLKLMKTVADIEKVRNNEDVNIFDVKALVDQVYLLPSEVKTVVR